MLPGRGLNPMSESLSYRDFIMAFRNLGLRRNSRVLVHASLEGLGTVAGGADTIIVRSRTCRRGAPLL